MWWTVTRAAARLTARAVAPGQSTLAKSPAGTPVAQKNARNASRTTPPDPPRKKMAAAHPRVVPARPRGTRSAASMSPTAMIVTHGGGKIRAYSSAGPTRRAPVDMTAASTAALIAIPVPGRPVARLVEVVCGEELGVVVMSAASRAAPGAHIRRRSRGGATWVVPPGRTPGPRGDLAVRIRRAGCAASRSRDGPRRAPRAARRARAARPGPAAPRTGTTPGRRPCRAPGSTASRSSGSPRT